MVHTIFFDDGTRSAADSCFEFVIEVQVVLRGNVGSAVAEEEEFELAVLIVGDYIPQTAFGGTEENTVVRHRYTALHGLAEKRSYRVALISAGVGITRSAPRRVVTMEAAALARFSISVRRSFVKASMPFSSSQNLFHVTLPPQER